MRRRQRHLNARHAGAMFVLDARFINQADNTAVSTWADRSGNGYDVSQATSTQQPILRTQAKGGSSVVRFDGSNDAMYRSDSVFPTGDFTAIGTHIQSTAITSTGQYRTIYHYGSASAGRAVFYCYGEDLNFGNDGFGISNYADSFSVQNVTTVWNVTLGTRSGTSYFVRMNGAASNSKTMTVATLSYGANGFACGSFNASLSYGSYLGGDIGTVMIFASSLTDSLRRRLERGCGLTWKIACS